MNLQLAEILLQYPGYKPIMAPMLPDRSVWDVVFQCRNNYIAVDLWRGGHPKFVWFYNANVLHRDDGPAKSAFDQIGNLLWTEIWVDGFCCETRKFYDT